MKLFDAKRKLELREAVSDYCSAAAGIILAIAPWAAWSLPSGLALVAIAIFIVLVGAALAPPFWWRWGKYPTPVKDPSHEHKI